MKSAREQLFEYERTGVFRCGFCGGRGCLDCDTKKERLLKQRDEEYAREFPNGPQPIFTANLTTPSELSRMNAEGCPNELEPQDILRDTFSRMSAEDQKVLQAIFSSARRNGQVAD